MSWVNACKSGFGSKEHKALTSTFDYAGPLTESLLIGNLALRSYMTKFENNKFDGRKKLEWDTKNMQVTNFDLANQFIKRKYSSGWNLD